MSPGHGSSRLLAAFLLLGGVLAAQGKGPVLGPSNYSATMVIHLKGGATQRMAIAKRGSKWSSTVAMPGNRSMHQIVLFDTKMMYMMMPGMCMAHPLTSLPPAGVLEEAYQHHATITDLGPAKVEVGEKSYVCEQRRVVYTAKSGERYDMRVFTANDLQNFPVKIIMTNHGRTTTVTYENIRLSPPAAAEFAPPVNCRAMPGIPGMPRPH